MTRPLDPFDFDDEDDDDAATVLMSGHKRALLREALRTPAPLDATVLDPTDESEVSARPASVEAPVVDEDTRTTRIVVLMCMAVLMVAVAMSSYAVLIARP